MKKVNYFKKGLMLVIATVLINNLSGQGNSRDIIMKAMKDELKRNIEKLSLEKLQRPFFISYTVNDEKYYTIEATLGSIISIKDEPYRDYHYRVMVGNYKLNDENYKDMNLGSMAQYSRRESLPLEDDYNGIRRAFWLSIDALYKDAAENYERKLSSIKQQNRTAEEDSLSDFSKAPVVKMILPPKIIKFDKTDLENAAKELSAVFRNYPDIYSSNVLVNICQSDILFTNSEGTEAIYPVSIAYLFINASTQATNGEELKDHLLYYALTPEELPQTQAIKADIESMIKNLIALRTASVYEDSYSGPVLFEGQAAGELIAQRLFSSPSGLIADRTPIYSNPSVEKFMGRNKQKSLEDKIGRKIFPNDFTIKATPKTASFMGNPLIGTFNIDAEGVVPDDELVLVDKGILKTLINGRIPTTGVNHSNGYNRLKVESTYYTVAPGVITINTANTISEDKMKEKLLQKAKDEGLTYAFIVRKFLVNNSGMLSKMNLMDMLTPENILSGGDEGQSSISKPIYIYKVYVNDGKEELVRSAKLSGIQINAFKNIIAASDKQVGYNTFITKPENNFGIMMSIGNQVPASFIMPNSLLFEEMEIVKDKKAFTPKLPIVQNPVANPD